MSGRELHWVEVLPAVQAGRRMVTAAAIGISQRQAQRLVKAYRRTSPRVGVARAVGASNATSGGIWHRPTSVSG